MIARGAPKGAPEARTARYKAHPHLTPAGRQAIQVPLPISTESPPPRVQDAEDLMYPERPWHPAEAHLRFVMNTPLRCRHHWWLLTESGRPQREYLQRLGRWAA